MDDRKKATNITHQSTARKEQGQPMPNYRKDTAEEAPDQNYNAFTEESDLGQVQYILAMPKSRFYWKYQLDDGKVHSIDPDGIFPYLKKFVEPKDYARLQDMIRRFQMILVEIATKRLIELHPDKSVETETRDRISSEIQDIAQSRTHLDQALQSMDERKGGKIAGDDTISDMQKRFYETVRNSDMKGRTVLDGNGYHTRRDERKPHPDGFGMWNLTGNR